MSLRVALRQQTMVDHNVKHAEGNTKLNGSWSASERNEANADEVRKSPDGAGITSDDGRETFP